MRALSRWLTLLAVLAACGATAFAAYTLAGRAWDGVVEYRSPYVSPDRPESPAEPPVAQRVVLVIVDGLRADAARDMSTLSTLRDYASDYTLTAPQPSLSYPNWTTILSGAPPQVSGVVTNWHEGSAPVETLLDTAARARVPFVVVGPSDIATLYPAATRADGSFFREWTDEYLAATYVDAALRLVDEKKPRFVFLHIPDVDEAGHDFGGASPEYRTTVGRVDADLRRLVEGLQDTKTAFVFVTDHGHIDSGGHGGWEPEVTQVPSVFAGASVNLGVGQASLTDVAPTVAVLAGLPVPRYSSGQELYSVVATSAEGPGMTAARQQRIGFARDRIDSILATRVDEVTRQEILDLLESDPAAAVALAIERREAVDRTSRLPYGAALGAAALFALALIGVASVRALIAALAGTAAYYAFYNGLFFVLHGYRWSLSAFNTEELVDAWMNTRLVEAALAGLVAAAVAAAVYPLLRRSPKGPHREFLPGWLTLGPTTVLVVQATLALQAAWFIWWWGVTPEWRLPDLMWGFKFDLDLIQATALGAAALLSPVVTYLVGRYHRSVIRAEKALAAALAARRAE